MDNIKGGSLPVVYHSDGKTKVRKAVNKFFARIVMIPIQKNVNELVWFLGRIAEVLQPRVFEKPINFRRTGRIKMS